MIKQLVFVLALVFAFSISAQKVCLDCEGGGIGGGGITISITGPTAVNLNGTYTYYVSSSTGTPSSTSYQTWGGQIISYGAHQVTVKWTSPGSSRWVRATSQVNGNSYTSPSKYVTVSINPAAITPVAAEESHKSTTSFRANWSDISGADSYKLYVYTNSSLTQYAPGFNSNGVTITGGFGGVTTSQFNVSGLSPGRNYYYRVKAVVGSTQSNFSNTITANTTISPPSALNETSNAITSFVARWSGISGVSSFRLDVSTSSSFSSYVSGYQNKSVTGTSHTVTGLPAGKYYYYRLRAVGLHHTSGNSNTVTAHTNISTPTASQEDQHATTSFRAKWIAVNGATSYRLYVSGNSSFTEMVSGYNGKTVSGSSHTVTGLTPGRFYYYRMTATGPTHSTGYSGTITANTTLSNPVALSGDTKTTNTFRARWNAVSGAVSYKLYVCTNSTFNYGMVNGYNGVSVGNTTNKTVYGLQPGIQYYYRVKAIGDAYTSSYSGTITTNTIIDAPSGIEEDTKSVNSFRARWTAVSGATSYKLYVSDNASFSSHVNGFNGLTVTGATQTVSGLLPGKSYYYRVKAVSAVHTSGYSGIITANTILGTPVISAESNNSTSSFTASWSSLSGATSYLFYVSDNPSFSSHINGYNGLSVTGTSQNVTGLASGRHYYYRIKAVSSVYTSEYSTQEMAYTTLAIPSIANETANATDEFIANWNPSPGATSYLLYVSDIASFSSHLPGYNGKSVSYPTSDLVTGLDPGKIYYYRVKAVSVAYTTGYSAHTQAHSTVSVPSIASETDNSHDGFMANWSSSAGATGYVLYVSENSAFTSHVIGYDGLSVFNTSHLLTGLASGKNYYYRVKAVGPNFNSAYSASNTAHTTIAAPVANAVVNRTIDSFVASWNSVSDAGEYRLDVSTSSTFSSYVPGYQNLQVTGTNQNITGLTNQTYYYRVRAVGAAITSSNSSAITVGPTFYAGSISHNSTNCENAAIGILNGTPAEHGLGIYTYKWEKWDGTIWNVVAEGTEYQNYSTLDLLTSQVKYRRTVTDESSVSLTTSELVITPIVCELANTNYVRTELLRVPVTDESLITPMNYLQKSTSYSYADGAGRPMMSIAAEAGPGQEDVVAYSTYDANTGKQLTTYLPYTISSPEPGSYRHNFSIEQELFYQQGGELASDTKPYSVVEYENSPLGRVKSVLAPGDAYHSNDKKTTYNYFFYDGASAGTSDEVHHWVINGAGNPEIATSSNYGSNFLRVTEMVSPDGRKTQSIVDGRGLSIASRKWDGIGWNTTYNVYDDLGRLRFVIPPKMANTANLTAAQIAGFLFEYRYDNRGRAIEFKSPGAGWTYAVYDEWNRSVMSRHDGLKDENGNAAWTFVKYDRLNRAIVSGIVTTSKDRSMLQAELDAATAGLTAKRYENQTTNAEGYTLHNSFPDLQNDYTVHELHNISYYDDYGFLNNTNWDAESLNFNFNMPSGFTATFTTAVKGLATGGKVKVLGSDKWLNSVIYYDNRLRAIQGISENHLGGTDRVSSELDYIGQVEKSLLQHTGKEAVDVLTEYTYDHAGRLLETYETVGNASRTMVANYNYNMLGELIEKNIHSTDGGASFLQSVDYSYTINKQLKAINNSQLTQGAEAIQDVFGMELNYTSAVAINGQTVDRSFDGNIASVSWKNGVPSGEKTYEESIYGYAYNDLNQLTGASFATKNGANWTGNGGYFDMTASYDEQGNTQTLIRQSGGTTIDNLDFDYDANSNKLNGVADLSNEAAGMNDQYSAAGEYEYNAMGNRTVDQNKEIVSISYNHLQLVDSVEFGDNTLILNTYDAGGSKLSKKVVDGDGKVISKVDYVGLVEYLDDAINQVFIEGGRSYEQNGTFHNEYFLGDHQGNNRVAFGNLPGRYIYTATMETEESAMEESEFAFPLNTLKDTTNHTPLGNESITLNHLYGRSVGPAKVLTITNGDHVDLEVWAHYKQAGTNTGTYNSIATAILSALGLSTGDAGAGDAVNGAIGTGGSADYIPTSTSLPTDAPDAYLQYLFYDANYNFIPGNSGFVEVTSASYEKFQKLEVPNGLDFTQNGYLFVYVVNETQEDQEVLFDDIKIVHENSTLAFKVSQVNEYYPYGMPTSNGYRAEGYIDPGFLYQAAYANYDELTSNYDFLFRSYDPALGQFFAVDPMAAATAGYSPYHSNYNNPIMYTDPMGLCPDCQYGDEPVFVDSNPHVRGGGYSGYSGNDRGYYSGKHWTGDNKTNEVIKSKHFHALSPGSYKRNSSGSFERKKITGYHWLYSDTKKSFSGKESVIKGDGIHYDFLWRLKDFHLNNVRPILMILTQYPNNDNYTNVFIASGILAGENIVYNSATGTWLGRNGKFYPASWGGNRFTGGKIKFARRLNSRIKIGGKLGGALLWAYNADQLILKYENGEISEREMWIEQGFNAASSVAPGIYGVGIGFGHELGKDYGPSKWYGKNDKKWFK